MLRVLRAQCVPIGGADRVVIAPAILSIIGRILFPPRFGVETAVRPLRHIVLAQQIHVEELARVVGAVTPWVAVVVRRGSSAGAGTQPSIVDAREILLADVVSGCVDRAAKFGGAGESGLSVRRVVLGITVTACDHNVEITAPLAIIDSRFGGDAAAPEGALDVCERGRVGTAIGWVDRGVALKVNVEGSAEVGSVAELLALDGVVGFESGETHIRVGIY